MLEGNVFYYEWEVALIRAVQAHFGSFGVFISQLLSLLGQEYPLVAIVVILFFSKKKELGKKICMNLLTVLVWVPMVKNLTFRIRPYFAHDDVDILLPPVPTEDAYDMVAQGYSFPSAHSACAVSAYPSLFNSFNKKILKIIGILIPGLVGISRFCVGAHYPTDVLVGWAIGLIVVFLLAFLREKLKNEDLVNFIVLLTAVPGLFYCKTEDFFSGFGLLLGCCIGFWFEAKYVNFTASKNIKETIIRTICGLAVFLLFGQGLKFVLGHSILVRVFRYALGSFMAIGIYPMIFKRFEKEK